MAFYKYGFAFLAGTGFGAAMTSLRRENYPLHRRHHHCCHHRRCHHDQLHDDHEHAAELESKEAAGDERYMRESKKGTMVKAKKGSNKEKKAAAAAWEEEEDAE